jgi:hypothetical protein
MHLPMELADLVIRHVKLSRKNLMELEAGTFLMSALTQGPPTNPVFAEKVAPPSKRDEQWSRIKDASADQRNCMIFKNKHDYNKWIKGCEVEYKKWLER